MGCGDAGVARPFYAAHRRGGAVQDLVAQSTQAGERAPAWVRASVGEVCLTGGLRRGPPRSRGERSFGRHGRSMRRQEESQEEERVLRPVPEYVRHKGVRILRVDFSGCEGGDGQIALMKAAMGVIALEPPLSIRMISMCQPPLCQAIQEASRRYAQHNARYVRASAVVGLNAFQRAALWPMVAQRPGKVAVFDDGVSALDWLASQ